MREVLEDIKGYEGLYQVSDKGRVFSNKVISGRGTRYGRELKPFPTQDGYIKVKLCDSTKEVPEKTISIHRLVAMAFIPNPNNLECINHIDGNKLNNCVENLEWCTRKENNDHSSRTGLISHGEGRPGHKLTEEDVIQIYKLKDIMTNKDLSQIFGVSENTIGLIKRGKKWSYLYKQYFKQEIVEILDNQQPNFSSAEKEVQRLEII